MDVKVNDLGDYEVFAKNGKDKTGKKPAQWAKEVGPDGDHFGSLLGPLSGPLLGQVSATFGTTLPISDSGPLLSRLVRS